MTYAQNTNYFDKKKVHTHYLGFDPTYCQTLTLIGLLLLSQLFITLFSERKLQNDRKDTRFYPSSRKTKWYYSLLFLLFSSSIKVYLPFCLSFSFLSFSLSFFFLSLPLSSVHKFPTTLLGTKLCVFCWLRRPMWWVTWWVIMPIDESWWWVITTMWPSCFHMVQPWNLDMCSFSVQFIIKSSTRIIYVIVKILKNF